MRNDLIGRVQMARSLWDDGWVCARPIACDVEAQCSGARAFSERAPLECPLDRRVHGY